MQKTVLITGAGFSIPYGYPSGKSLVTDIIKFYKGHERLDFLSKILNDTSHESIDSFIYEQNELGRKDIADAAINAISYQILEAEDRSLSKETDESQDIVKFILNRIDENEYKNLTVITFNYDRYLEYKLYNKLYSKYQDNTKAMSILKTINIIHMHGRMIPFCENDISGYTNDKIVPYAVRNYCNFHRLNNTTETMFRSMAVNFALKDFKTVDSETDDRSELAKTAIKSAQRVFFLGFGFDHKNMAKLGITSNNCKEWAPYDWANKTVAATSLGIKPIQLKEIKINYPILQNSLFTANARDFFETHFNLTNHQYDHEIRKIGPCCKMNAKQNFSPPGPNSRPTTYGHTIDVICATCDKQSKAHFEFGHRGWQIGNIF